jgi:hypothetical protein
MAGLNGSVLENFEMDDIDGTDNENEDDGTINGLLLSRNKQMKRSNSGTSRTVTHNNQQKLLFRDKIAPVVYYKIDNVMKDPMKLNNYLKEKVKDVKIINVRYSNNGNVSIYTNSEDDNLKLEKNEELFSGSSRLNLQNIDKIPCLMIKNITYEYAMENEQSLKEKYDVKEIVKFVSKQDVNKSIKMVKAVFNTEEMRKMVLNSGFMLIGCFKFYVEEYCKPPIQCRTCKGFGHIAAKCESRRKCGFCTEEHDENDCSNKQIQQALKCANCNQNHSAYYRGCHIYKQVKTLKAQNGNKPLKVPQNYFERNYSAAANNTNDELKNLILQLNENTVKAIKIEGETTRKAIEDMRVDNNLRQAYFIIDSIKALNPANKVTETAIKSITTSFSKHGLGELNEDHLNSYYRGIKSKDNGVNNINYQPTRK